MIETTRLKLVPATVALSRAENFDRAAFASLLDAVVPENWPPESSADALPLFLEWLEAAPDSAGWFGWYALARADDTERRVLVGGGGFLGPPHDGQVSIGYSVLPQFQGRGYATEMAGALVRWALSRPDLDRVVAETEWANPVSVRVLLRLGFVESGPGSEPAGGRYLLTRAG